MAWDYAELLKMAKANGGPEKLVDLLINSGKRKMFPWLGVAAAVGVATTVAVQKVFKYLSDKKFFVICTVFVFLNFFIHSDDRCISSLCKKV